MKMTLDLPNELVRETKLRAVHEGRKFKDMVASLLAAGIAAESAKAKATSRRKGTLKLPLFKCAKNAPARRMSIDEILALEQSTQLQEDLERQG
jgi:hypothetical protein